MKRVFFAEDGVTVINVGVIGDDAEPIEGTLDVEDDAFVGTGMHRQEGGSFAAPAPSPPTVDQVDAERDRRTVAGVAFNGTRFQTRPQDRENIAGAAVLALGAMVAGAQPGNTHWHGGAYPFAWIAEDNSTVVMDAQTVFAFAQAVAAQKSALIFAARALKNMAPIPVDFTDDAYWPA